MGIFSDVGSFFQDNVVDPIKDNPASILFPGLAAANLPALSAAGEALGGSGGPATATQTTQRLPAPMEPYMQQVLDEVLGSFFGQQAGVVGRKGDMKGPVYQEAIPSYQERIQQDVDSQAGAGKDFLSALSQLTSGYQGSTGDATTAYNDRLSGLDREIQSASDQYTRPAFNISVGGQQTGIVPRRNLSILESLRESANQRGGMYGNMYTSNIDQSGRALNTGKELESARLMDAMQNTPNRAYFDYMNVLMPWLQQNQGYRYSIPTENQTGTYDANEGWLDKLSQLAGVGAGVGGLLTGIGNISAQKP